MKNEEIEKKQLLIDFLDYIQNIEKWPYSSSIERVDNYLKSINHNKNMDLPDNNNFFGIKYSYSNPEKHKLINLNDNNLKTITK